jgi:hypothetical protein
MGNVIEPRKTNMLLLMCNRKQEIYMEQVIIS